MGEERGRENIEDLYNRRRGMSTEVPFRPPPDCRRLEMYTDQFKEELDKRRENLKGNEDPSCPNPNIITKTTIDKSFYDPTPLLAPSSDQNQKREFCRLCQDGCGKVPNRDARPIGRDILEQVGGVTRPGCPPKTDCCPNSDERKAYIPEEDRSGTKSNPTDANTRPAAMCNTYDASPSSFNPISYNSEESGCRLPPESEGPRRGNDDGCPISCVSEKSKNLPQDLVTPSNTLDLTYELFRPPVCSTRIGAGPGYEDTRNNRTDVGNRTYPSPKYNPNFNSFQHQAYVEDGTSPNQLPVCNSRIGAGAGYEDTRNRAYTSPRDRPNFNSFQPQASDTLKGAGPGREDTRSRTAAGNRIYTSPEYNPNFNSFQTPACPLKVCEDARYRTVALEPKGPRSRNNLPQDFVTPSGSIDANYESFHPPMYSTPRKTSPEWEDLRGDLDDRCPVRRPDNRPNQSQYMIGPSTSFGPTYDSFHPQIHSTPRKTRPEWEDATINDYRNPERRVKTKTGVGDRTYTSPNQPPLRRGHLDYSPAYGNQSRVRSELEDSRMRSMLGPDYYPYAYDEKRKEPFGKGKRLEESRFEEEQGLQVPPENLYPNRSPYPESEGNSGGQAYAVHDYGPRNIPPANGIIYSHPLNDKQLMVLKVPVENSQVQGWKNVLNIQIWSAEESPRSPEGTGEKSLREKGPDMPGVEKQNIVRTAPEKELVRADFTSLHGTLNNDWTNNNAEQQNIVRTAPEKPKEPGWADFTSLYGTQIDDTTNYNAEQENIVRVPVNQQREDLDVTEFKTLHDIHEEDTTYFGTENGEVKEGGGVKKD